MFCGGSSGQIFKFSQAVNKATGYQVHKGVIHCVKYIAQYEDNKSVILSGGTDKVVKVSDATTMQELNLITLDSCPRSVDYARYLLIGLRNGSVVECDVKKEIKETIAHSHHDGEVWGLCVIPSENKYVTSGDDNKILMFDMQTKRCVQRGYVVRATETEASAVSKQKGYVGGASTSSLEPPANQSRALAWCESLKHLAVATNEGKVSIRAITFQKGNHLDEIVTSLSNAKEWIECMAYSPSETYLGVGSHDNNIYLYTCGETKYNLYAKLTGHSSFITSFDWSLDSEKIRSNSGAAELTFWDVKLKKKNLQGASQTIGDTWATQTNKYGWSVNGIFPPSCDGTHINTVA